MVEFGFPMGPLTLTDMAGLDILASTDRVLSRTFSHHGGASSIVERLVEAGHLGQKTLSGVYKYARGDHTPLKSEAARRIVTDVQQQENRTPRAIGPEEIIRRLVLRMVAEAFCVLEEGIAQRESDIDVAMVLATGFPDFRGGVLKYARDLGLVEVCGQLEELAETCGERFAPCQLLRDMKGVR